MPERQPQTGPALPDDPSEEELARDWTRSEADRVEVLRCRGDDNRRRFALQLCVVRQYGRFVDRYSSVSVRILNHLNRQLRLMPTVSLPEAERDATESSHQQRLREYLGYRTFDDQFRILLEEHLRSRVAQGAWPEDLFDSAVDALRFWKIVPSAVANVGRIAASIAAVGREEMFGRITSRLDQLRLRTSTHRQKSSLRTSVQSAVSFACQSIGASSGTFSSRTLVQSLSVVRKRPSVDSSARIIMTREPTDESMNRRRFVSRVAMLPWCIVNVVGLEWNLWRCWPGKIGNARSAFQCVRHRKSAITG
jgi:hypothetical protein